MSLPYDRRRETTAGTRRASAGRAVSSSGLRPGA
jgi:hypothetical protein